MRHYEWNDEKNARLRAERGVSFADVVAAVQTGDVLDDMTHPNTQRYAHQRLLVVCIEGYAYLAPYVEKGHDTLFLKTIIPSRVATKKYVQGGRK